MPSRKISCCILTEINPDFWSRPSPLLSKTDSYRSTSHKNLQKQTNEDFFNQLLYSWLFSPIKTSLPLIYSRNSCPSHIFKTTCTRLDFKHHPTQEYFRQIYHHYLGPLQISTTRSNFLYDILQETRFSCCQPYDRYVKLHWAQLPMIGNTQN